MARYAITAKDGSRVDISSDLDKVVRWARTYKKTKREAEITCDGKVIGHVGPDDSVREGWAIWVNGKYQ